MPLCCFCLLLLLLLLHADCLPAAAAAAALRCGLLYFAACLLVWLAVRACLMFCLLAGCIVSVSPTLRPARFDRKPHAKSESISLGR